MGPGLVATEWSHAYVAMGLLLSHQSQTALLARVYNLDSAVSFVVAIAEDLGYRVRQGAISASDDDAGRQLRDTFQAGLAVHGPVLYLVQAADLASPLAVHGNVRQTDEHGQSRCEGDAVHGAINPEDEEAVRGS